MQRGSNPRGGLLFMRDPNRIDRIVEKLAKEWKKNPDQRLGQLLCNLDRDFGRMPFFYEDDKIERALDRSMMKE